MGDPSRRGAQRVGLAALAVALGLPAVVAPVPAPAAGPAAPGRQGSPFLDRRAAPPASPRVRAARAQLRRELGGRMAFGVDGASGATRVVQRLDGALSQPASGPRAGVARAWVQDHRALFGLDAADAAALEVTGTRTGGRSGITSVRLAQRPGGIEVFDGGLVVSLDRGGRVLGVVGQPVATPDAGPTTPRLDAAAARAAFDAGAGPTTPLAPARLTRFPGARGTRLAWRLLERRSSTTTYDVVVDATDGEVLFRQDLTKGEAPATIHPSFPGAEDDPRSGLANAPQEVDLEAAGWLPPGATRLEGPTVRAFSDLDGDDVASAGEEVEPHDGSDFRFPFTSWAGPNCGPPGARCAWDPALPGSWRANREQDGVQAFALANRFHDHLRRAVIGFDGFGGADPVVLNTLDGAGLGEERPINNANMTVLPEGASPKLQTYLFGGRGFRAIDGGDDAATVWHEYAHGLSGRLVTHADGTSALSSVQGGALGEAWSDFYALDLLSREGLLPDDAGVPGQMDVGRASDATPHTSRSQAADCPVGATAPACPGRGSAGEGGYTLGDLGRVSGYGPEVHYDGEVWLETLWDLRAALVAGSGSEAAGSDLAERLVTDGMRLGPPEPSFVDARNAIFAAATAAGDPVVGGEPLRDLLWRVFAGRGLGLQAHVADANDTAPVESTVTPATAGPDGTVRGRVVDAAGGLPLPGVSVTTDAPDAPQATTGTDGTYALALPSGAATALLFTGPAGYDPEVASTSIPAGGSVTLDAQLRRNWAAAAGGTTIAGGVQDPPCGPGQLIDDIPGSGWSSVPGHRSVTLDLPTAVDVSQVGIDPSPTCGDGPASALEAFTLVAVAPDGQERVMATQGTPVLPRPGKLQLRVPGNARGVTRVRLVLEASAGTSDFIDVSRLALYGTRSDGAPRGTLRATPATVNPSEAITFDATSFTDPDSLIASYSWDFDGDGRTDRTTSEATTRFAYAAPGLRNAQVVVRDVGDADGRASASVRVLDPTPPTPPATTPPAAPVPAPPSITRGSVTIVPPSFAPAIFVAARSRRAIRITTRCSTPCSLRASGSVGAVTARRLGRTSRSVMRVTRSASVGGTVSLGLSSAVLRAAKRRGLATLTVRVTATATDARRRVATRRARVRVAL